MSNWTYINGTITVSPMGRTQHEKTYILNTVLDHLPRVTGSERDMNIYVNQKNGTNSGCSVDEFGCSTNNLTDDRGDKSRKYGWLRTQDEYILTVDASLRDRRFNDTLKEFNYWLCRLAKRLQIEDILVRVEGYDKSILITNKKTYNDMFEYPSWSMYGEKENSENWCEYLMWEEPRDEENNLLCGKPE